jgi:acyl-CoA thioesterase I
MRRRRAQQSAACAALLCFSAGCGSGEPGRVATSAGPPSVATPERATRPRIVVLGDSLTAGLGLGPDEAYPSILQRRLDAGGLTYEVVNAGVSGDTSAGGLRRLDWSLAGDVRVLIVALGGNDALRGLPVTELRSNLELIIKQALAKKITVVLAGMEAPPNFGRAYTDEFRKVYASLAKQYNVALVPFLLQGVAGVESMNQADGIHPSAAGARIAADNVWAALEPIVRRF